MVIQEFKTLDEFVSYDAIKYKNYDRLVVRDITTIPTDVLDNALFKCFIRDIGKFVIIKNETYDDAYELWRDRCREKNKRGSSYIS